MLTVWYHCNLFIVLTKFTHSYMGTRYINSWTFVHSTISSLLRFFLPPILHFFILLLIPSFSIPTFLLYPFIQSSIPPFLHLSISSFLHSCIHLLQLSSKNWLTWCWLYGGHLWQHPKPACRPPVQLPPWPACPLGLSFQRAAPAPPAGRSPAWSSAAEYCGVINITVRRYGLRYKI